VSAFARRVLTSALVLGLTGVMVGLGTWAAFSGTAVSGGNSFAAGTVTIQDNDAGVAMLSLTNALPGATDTGCIKVTYTGSLDSNVRLYGATTRTGLDQYLDLTVTRGTYTPTEPSFDSCTNFAGVVDPISGSPEAWTTNEVHVSKIQVTLQSNSAAQGTNATQSFVPGGAEHLGVR
jgi:predicted ribosomally synthesized peptide with SipW-like signal peptide